jgi:periplasmic divalent cation tolerance protein
MKKIVLVLTTMPSDARAAALAKTLVDERLAACVNLSAPLRSIYRWKGTVADEEECQLVIKTTAARVAALRERIASLHPYDLPELLVVEAEGSDAYVSWVAAETSGRDT